MMAGSSLADGLLVINHQIDGDGGHAAHTIGLLRPMHVGEKPVLRRIGRHHDRIGTALASLGQYPLSGVARASDLAASLNVATPQPSDRARDALVSFLQFS